MNLTIGKRFLYTAGALNTLHYGVVKELSPSGKFARLDERWVQVDTISVVEAFPAAETTTASTDPVPVVNPPAETKTE